ncbi:MAG TPA: hypothetical protein VES67_24310 [Vicinamibacterales bacterium]|nr:hypothetical protein [Vicinamibacterales bacterium]
MTTLLVIGWLASTPAVDTVGRVAEAQPALVLTTTAGLANNIDRVALSTRRNLTLTRAASTSNRSFANRQKSTAQKIVNSVFGVVGGFFLGGYTGAAIEGNSCKCDDPGLKGFMIGAPIGAVVGGILGGRW